MAELFDIELGDLEDAEEYDTVGGLIYHRIGGVPKPGDKVEIKEYGLTLTVEVTDHRVGKVLAVLNRTDHSDGRNEPKGGEGGPRWISVGDWFVKTPPVHPAIRRIAAVHAGRPCFGRRPQESVQPVLCGSYGTVSGRSMGGRVNRMPPASGWSRPRERRCSGQTRRCRSRPGPSRARTCARWCSLRFAIRATAASPAWPGRWYCNGLPRVTPLPRPQL